MPLRHMMSTIIRGSFLVALLTLLIHPLQSAYAGIEIPMNPDTIRGMTGNALVTPDNTLTIRSTIQWQLAPDSLGTNTDLGLLWAYDPTSKQLATVNQATCTIAIINEMGLTTSSFGSCGTGIAQIPNPTGIVFDNGEVVILSDQIQWHPDPNTVNTDNGSDLVAKEWLPYHHAQLDRFSSLGQLLSSTPLPPFAQPLTRTNFGSYNIWAASDTTVSTWPDGQPATSSNNTQLRCGSHTPPGGITTPDYCVFWGLNNGPRAPLSNRTVVTDPGMTFSKLTKTSGGWTVTNGMDWGQLYLIQADGTISKLSPGGIPVGPTPAQLAPFRKHPFLVSLDNGNLVGTFGKTPCIDTCTTTDLSPGHENLQVGIFDPSGSPLVTIPKTGQSTLGQYTLGGTITTLSAIPGTNNFLVADGTQVLEFDQNGIYVGKIPMPADIMIALTEKDAWISAGGMLNAATRKHHYPTTTEWAITRESLDPTKWQAMNGISIDGTQDSGSVVAFAFSTDGRLTWKTWNRSNRSWDRLSSPGNLDTTGLTPALAAGLKKEDYDLLLQDAATLDVMVAMHASPDAFAAPIISSLALDVDGRLVKTKFTPDHGKAPITVTGTITVIDPTVSPVTTIDWGDQGGNQVVTKETVTHDYATSGQYTITVTSVGAGVTQVATKVIEVLDAQAPDVVLSYTRRGGTSQAPVVLDFVANLTGMAPGDKVKTYQWVITRPDGTQVTLGTATNKNKNTFKLLDVGVNTVAVTVATAHGGVGMNSVDIVVDDPPPFTLTLSQKVPKFNRPPAMYFFQAKSSYDSLKTDQVDPKAWNVIVKDSQENVVATGKAGSIRITFQQPGDYTVVFQAQTKILRLQAEESTTVTINDNQPPIIDSITAKKVGRRPGDLNYDIIVAAHDDDGRIKSYKITVDGKDYTKSRLRYAFQQTGSAEVDVTVTDDSGATTTGSQTVTVTDTP